MRSFAFALFGLLLASPLTAEDSGEDLELAATLKMLSAHAPLRRSDVADPDSAPNRAMVETLLQRTLEKRTGAPDRPISPLPDSTGIPGTLSGSFSVDNKGAAKYQITLPIPRSRDGLRPYPSVSYASNVGSGVMGEGFYFATGLHGSITRGRSLLARDDEARGTELGERDKFYFDGKRLLCISGPAGRPGSRYRTEVDSFVTVDALGRGDTIETFVLRDKDGETYTFGRIGDQLDGLQRGYDEDTDELDTVTAEYALKRAEDRSGNYVTLSYEHKGHGEWLLAQIQYTGRGELPPQYSIRLAYEPKAGPGVQYQARRRFDHRQLLVAIRIFAAGNNDPVAEYLPRYLAPGAEGGVHRLIAFGGSFSPDVGQPRQVLPATRFQWAEGPDPEHRWQEFPLPAPPPGPAVQAWGDFNGDGRDDLLVFDGSARLSLSTREGVGEKTETWLEEKDLPPALATAGRRCLQTGDFDGDGLTDLLITGDNGQVAAFRSTGTKFALLTLFAPAGWPGERTTGRAPADAEQWAQRVRVGDFNGDGRSDLLIHPDNDRLVTLLSNGSSFQARPDPAVSRAGEAVAPARPTPVVLAAMLVDLNGDGNDDYTWLASARANGAAVVLYCALARPAGGFAAPQLLHQWPGAYAVRVGEFNRDGLPDFLIGEPGAGNNAAWTWQVLLNRGQPVDATGPVERFYRRIALVLPGAPDRSQPDRRPIPPAASKTLRPRSLEAGPDFAPLCVDVNHDGLDDLVWPPLRRTDAPAGGASDRSQVSFAVGDGTFAPARELAGRAWEQIFPASPAPASGQLRVAQILDVDGDGLAEWTVQHLAADGRETTSALISGAGDRPTPYPQDKLVTGITDGLGRTLDIGYRAAKDDAVYVAGAPVSFPIREMRSSRSVVSEIWHDTGGRGSSQFSYRYAGNRTDFSGRGGLGFIAFTTFDHQTGFCKVQFLAQAFPTTGLTRREQTYRAWRDGNEMLLEMISSTDETVVYDAVVDATTGRPYGTVYPFISHHQKSSWDNDGRACFSYPIGHRAVAPSWLGPKFAVPPTWVENTDHRFDRQASEQPVPLAPPAVRVPTILDNPWIVPARQVSLAAFPQKITFGNETAVVSTHRFGFYEREFKTYLPPRGPDDTLAGLISEVTHTKYVNKSEGVLCDPVTTRTYFKDTALPASEHFQYRDADGKPTGQVREVQYLRDDAGRLLTRREKSIDPGVAADDDHAAGKILYQAEDFDDETDLPAAETEEDGERKRLEHNLLFRKAARVVFDDDSDAIVTFDGFGRTVRVFYPKSGHRITTHYVWTALNAEGWRQRQFVPPPAGINGVAGQSIYAVLKSQTGKSSVIEYHDRMGRVIRVVVQEPDESYTSADTVYDELDRVVAESEACAPGSPVVWNTKTYDPYGNVASEAKLTTPATPPP